MEKADAVQDELRPEYRREDFGTMTRGTHPERPGHISVPRPRKDLGTGLLHKLMKQAGLK